VDCCRVGYVYMYTLGASLLPRQATIEKYRGLGCRSLLGGVSVPWLLLRMAVLGVQDFQSRPACLHRTWFAKVLADCMNQSNTSSRDARAALLCNGQFSSSSPSLRSNVSMWDQMRSSWTVMIEASYCRDRRVRIRPYVSSLQTHNICLSMLD
jgi:hypothetical protein